MNNFKLSIDLLPKGAWGNNLSHLLPKKDWDTIRSYVYAKANNRCEICGFTPTEDGQLDAHEEWDFDIKTKTQTLKNIIVLCSRCHGVKHYRNSNRLGYGDDAKKHFIKINNCSELDFATHLIQAEMIFEERNEVFRWKAVANLDRFGGKGIKVEPRNIPMIKNLYENVDWEKIGNNEEKRIFDLSEQKDFVGSPKVNSIEVDNYQGIITVVSLFTDRIEWFLNDKKIKTKYNVVGKFKTEFKVEGLEGSSLWFKLIGNGGTTTSKKFELIY